MKASISAWWVGPIAWLLACGELPQSQTPPVPLARQTGRDAVTIAPSCPPEPEFPPRSEERTKARREWIRCTTGKELAGEKLSAEYHFVAWAALKATSAMQDGPARDRQWHKVAALYRAALETAPDGDMAPEAAMNGGYAYKQIGEYDQAITMYTSFIEAYGDEATLIRLEKGDLAATPPVPADPKTYQERVQFLMQGREALSSAYVLSFDYRSAAESFDTTSRNPRFKKDERRMAARNAVVIYANIGDRDRKMSSRATFLALDPPAERKAELDYRVAAADLKAWDEAGLDEGANHAARLKVIAAMDGYYQANKSTTAALAFVVEAAFHAARARRAGKDPRADESCKNTIAAFERLRGAPPIVDGKSGALGSAQADMAAECAYDALDRKIKPRLDDDPRKAEGYVAQLQSVIDRFGSHRWSAAARARQGSVHDARRGAVHDARPPQLDAADRAMVRLYVESTVWARAWNVHDPAVEHAIHRLAFYTNLLGDAKIRELSQGILDPETKRPFEYRDGLFLHTHSGGTPRPTSDGLPPPLPRVP